MKVFFRALLKGFQQALRAGSIQPIRFEYKRSRRKKKFSNYYLLCRLKHEAHLLEKATKNPYAIGRGISRYQEVCELLTEVEYRKIKSNELIAWVKYVICKFNEWEKLGTNMVEHGGMQTDAHHLSTTSIRFWSSEIPDADKILNCIQAGQLAPASCNRQAFKVGVLRRNKIDVGYERGASNPSMFEAVPYRIFIFVNRDNYAEKYSQFIDVGMFSQNFILQAKEEELATCCCYASEHLDKSQRYWRTYFGLSSEYYCALTILVGYPDEVAIKPPRLDANELIIRKTS